jgi:cytochrome c oxidase assembly protein subunit 15
LVGCLAVAVLGQYVLGVATLLLGVPVSVATLHQCGAVILLTVVLVLVHHLSNAPRPLTETQLVFETPLI